MTTAAADASCVAADSACPECGAAFECAMGAARALPLPAARCWCFALPHAMAVPAGAAGDNTAAIRCLCPVCLQRRLAAADALGTTMASNEACPKLPPGNPKDPANAL